MQRSEKSICTFHIFFSAHSGDCNAFDQYHQTPLHRTLLHSTDLRLAEVMVEGGADLNVRDYKGNTPLGALCDPTPIDKEQLEEECCESDPVCNSLGGSSGQLQWLLDKPLLEVGNFSFVLKVFIFTKVPTAYMIQY